MKWGTRYIYSQLKLADPGDSLNFRTAAAEHTCDVGDHKVHEDVRCVTPDCEHRGKSWETDGHQDWDHDYACSEHFTKGTTAGIAREKESSFDNNYSDWRSRYSNLDSDW